MTNTYRSIQSLRTRLKTLRTRKKSIGFVPTMGALHEGHLSLLRRSRKENDITVLSIFVNPTQFGPSEDFRRYPRQEKNDERLAINENVDIIFYPTEKTLYPSGYLTYINIDTMTRHLCGASRPEHFRGVSTIVGKLLNIVQPDKMYLGQKDGQQAAIIRKMVHDLNIPVNVRICPTVREPDGLAMSSRNAYLTSQQRSEAPVLNRALKAAREEVRSGIKRAAIIEKLIRKNVNANSSADIQYVTCVDANTMQPVKTLTGRVMIGIAAHFGSTRLIDNITFTA